MRKLSRILELPKKHEYRRKVAFCWKKSHFSVYKARKPVRIAAFQLLRRFYALETISTTPYGYPEDGVDIDTELCDVACFLVDLVQIVPESNLKICDIVGNERLELEMNYANIPGYSDLQLTSTLLPIPQIISEMQNTTADKSIPSHHRLLRSFEERAFSGETAQNSTSYYRQFSRAGVPEQFRS